MDEKLIWTQVISLPWHKWRSRAMKSYSLTLSCGRALKVATWPKPKVMRVLHQILLLLLHRCSFFRLAPVQWSVPMVGCSGACCCRAASGSAELLHSHKTSSGLCSLPQRRLHSSLSEPQAQGAIVIQPLTAQSSRFRGERLHVWHSTLTSPAKLDAKQINTHLCREKKNLVDNSLTAAFTF